MFTSDVTILRTNIIGCNNLSSFLRSEVIQVRSIGCKRYSLLWFCFLCACRDALPRNLYRTFFACRVDFCMLQLYLHCRQTRYVRTRCRVSVRVTRAMIMSRRNDGLNRIRRWRGSTFTNTSFEVEVQSLENESLAHAFKGEVVFP